MTGTGAAGTGNATSGAVHLQPGTVRTMCSLSGGQLLKRAAQKRVHDLAGCRRGQGERFPDQKVLRQINVRRGVSCVTGSSSLDITGMLRGRMCGATSGDCHVRIWRTWLAATSHQTGTSPDHRDPNRGGGVEKGNWGEISGHWDQSFAEKSC
jgi:hypothetical protein